MTVVAPIQKIQPSNASIHDDDEEKFYWSVILEYWKLPPTFRHFPGPNPVSLERSNLDRVRNEDFLAALKSDGVRYLLLLTTKPNSIEPISIMVDRALNMYEVEIWANEEFFYNGSLLDGELVWNNENELHFIVFDVVCLKGIDCIKMNYRKRLEVIYTHILCTDQNLDDDTIERIISEEEKICARNNQYNLQIFPKNSVSKQRMDDLWNGKKTCSHRNDGIILTLNDAFIHTGTSKHIYKWKPSHSIDIKCYFVDDNWSFFANDNSSDDEIEITLCIGSFKVEIDVKSKLLVMLQRKSKCVVECLIVIDENIVTLIPERERTDKKTANTMRTIQATILNAQENLSIEELFKASHTNTSIKEDASKADTSEEETQQKN